MPVFIREFESVINNLPKQIGPCPKGFTGEDCQTVKEKIVPIFYNPFQIQKQREHFIIHSMNQNYHNFKTSTF